MKILICTNHPFPIGYAGTNRIEAYCYGFIANGVSVTVISTAWNSKISKTNSKEETWLDKVRIISLNLPASLHSRVLKRMLRLLTAILFPLVLISTYCLNSYKAALFYGTSFYSESIFTTISKLFKVKSLKEESENPSIYNRSSHLFKQMYNKFYIKDRYFKYDSILCMTKPLLSYFTKLGIDKHRLCLVPHTVILERFQNCIYYPQLKFDKYIAYVGSLSEGKDGVLSLIDAYSITNVWRKNVGMVICGFGSEHQVNIVEQRINSNGLENSIQLLIDVPNALIPSITSHAELLVSARPPSTQAEYGFPTKVVEYLATGRPVLTTANGDMKEYLINRVNCFVIEDFSIATIADMISEILSNIKPASQIGLAGKQLCQESFNPAINTMRIISYLQQM